MEVKFFGKGEHTIREQWVPYFNAFGITIKPDEMGRYSTTRGKTKYYWYDFFYNDQKLEVNYDRYSQTYSLNLSEGNSDNFLSVIISSDAPSTEKIDFFSRNKKISVYCSYYGNHVCLVIKCTNGENQEKKYYLDISTSLLKTLTVDLGIGHVNNSMEIFPGSKSIPSFNECFKMLLSQFNDINIDEEDRKWLNLLMNDFRVSARYESCVNEMPRDINEAYNDAYSSLVEKHDRQMRAILYQFGEDVERLRNEYDKTRKEFNENLRKEYIAIKYKRGL